MQVGIDTVEIKRIDSLIKNQERFLERVFSLKEQEEFIKRNNKTGKSLRLPFFYNHFKYF